MSTRKIIDPKHNGEKVWLKGHAQATFMSDGTTVEDKITSLESSGTDLTGYVKQEDLAAVATSGSYNDLFNKPTIPTKSSDLDDGANLLKSDNIKTVNGEDIVKGTDGVTDIKTQLAYAEYTGTATAAVVTTKYGYFPTTLVEGTSVAVKFEGSLTYITTLNVNGTGAKNVYYKGNSLTNGAISRYNTYIFVYDGSYYRIVGIDTDTHHTAKNVVTSSSTAKSNAAATNGNVYLNAVENSTVRSTHKIVGTGATAVTSDSSGNITIDTPIKTINGESIVGSGDITISGGESGSYTGNVFVHQLAFDFPMVYDVFEEGQYEVNSEDYGTFFDTADVGIIAEKIRTVGNVVVAVVDDHDVYQLLPATVWFDEQGVEFNILVYSPYSKYWYEILMNLQSGYQSIKRYKNYIEGGSSAYPQIDAGLDGDTFDIVPNTFYVFGEKTDLDITFIDAESSGNGGKACEYLFQFTSGSEGTTLVLNDDIKWASELVIEPNKIYQISILNGLGTVMSWDNSNLIAFIVLWGMSGTLNFECEKGMTWEAFVASSYNTDSALRIYNGNIGYGSYIIQDVTPTTIIENGKVYTSIYAD